MKTLSNRTIVTASLVGIGLLLAGQASAERPESDGSNRGRTTWATEHRVDATKAKSDHDRAKKQGKSRGKKHGHVRYKGKRFERADKNGDGFLTRDEVGQRRWNRMAKADANADEKISKQELATAFKERKAARVDRKMKRHDKNGDGFLTRDEVGQRRWNRMAKADANADEKISKQELATAFKERKRARNSRKVADGAERRTDGAEGRRGKKAKERPDHAGRKRSASE